jgi:hypothetical protein
VKPDLAGRPCRTVRTLGVASPLLGVGGLVLVLSDTLNWDPVIFLTIVGWAASPIFFFVSCLCTGRIATSGGVDSRTESPLAFWTGLFTYTTVIVLLSVAAIAYLWARMHGA